MIIDFLIHIEPQIQTGIEDYVGIALVVVTYFWIKNRKSKNRKIEETTA